MAVNIVFECTHLQKRHTHAVDVVCELSPLVLVDGMADIRIRTLHSDLAGLGANGGSLGAKFDVELSSRDLVRLPHCESREWDRPRPNPPARPCH